jgi:hypothetical protein
MKTNASKVGFGPNFCLNIYCWFPIFESCYWKYLFDICYCYGMKGISMEATCNKYYLVLHHAIFLVSPQYSINETKKRVVCNSWFLYLLSWRTFYMATISPVSKNCLSQQKQEQQIKIQFTSNLPKFKAIK